MRKQAQKPPFLTSETLKIARVLRHQTRLRVAEEVEISRLTDAALADLKVLLQGTHPEAAKRLSSLGEQLQKRRRTLLESLGLMHEEIGLYRRCLRLLNDRIDSRVPWPRYEFKD